MSREHGMWGVRTAIWYSTLYWYVYVHTIHILHLLYFIRNYYLRWISFAFIMHRHTLFTSGLFGSNLGSYRIYTTCTYDHITGLELLYVRTWFRWRVASTDALWVIQLIIGYVCIYVLTSQVLNFRLRNTVIVRIITVQYLRYLNW